MKGCSIIDAPSDLGLRRTGVDGLPDALRAAGLLEGLPDARYAGRLHVPPYVPLRDASANVLNPDGIRKFSFALAERVAFTLDLGRFPLILGGDCSILLGAALALRRRGRFGLFFLDGHADFYPPLSRAERRGRIDGAGGRDRPGAGGARSERRRGILDPPRRRRAQRMK